jgi:hypothetical protein
VYFAEVPKYIIKNIKNKINQIIANNLHQSAFSQFISVVNTFFCNLLISSSICNKSHTSSTSKYSQLTVFAISFKFESFNLLITYSQLYL